MTIKLKGKCEVEGCQAKAKYGLYRTDSQGGKEWLHVCRPHQEFIGNENARRATGKHKGGKQ